MRGAPVVPSPSRVGMMWSASPIALSLFFFFFTSSRRPARTVRFARHGRRAVRLGVSGVVRARRIVEGVKGRSRREERKSAGMRKSEDPTFQSDFSPPLLSRRAPHHPVARSTRTRTYAVLRPDPPRRRARRHQRAWVGRQGGVAPVRGAARRRRPVSILLEAWRWRASNAP